MATAQTGTMVARGGEHHGSIATASLAIGPLIMVVGDLLHPPESADVARQAEIIVDQPDRWYVAHLLLLVGFVILIPGLLALTGEAAARWPRTGRAARLLVLIGVSGISAIFAVEMLGGRLGSADHAATTILLDTLFSWQIAVPVFMIGLGFFVGTAVVAILMIRGARPLRLPAVLLLIGILLVMAEIMSSQVLLSQMGNVLTWLGALGFAWQLQRGGGAWAIAPE